MVIYIISRLIRLVIVFFVVTVVVFLLMHNVPGGPWDETNRNLTEQQRANMLAKFGLDKPLHEQYLTWVGNALKGDFGISYQFKDTSVIDVIASVWPKSIQLGGITVLISIALGVFMGILAGIRQNTWVDTVVTFISTLGMTVPNFIISIWMILILTVKLQWLPISLDADRWSDPTAWIMPVIALGLGPMGIAARFTRGSLTEVLTADYIRTARAKGLSETMVIWRHTMKNALIPIITALGPMVPNMITGTIFVETMFRVNGIGKFFVTSITSRDYPMILALMLMVASLWGLLYLLTDLVATVIDPRIKLD
jgi:ABC-type dipeptide/oligopeptide/nickel transport system permease component